MARLALLLSLLAVLLCAAPATAAMAPHGDEIPPGADAVLAEASGAVVTALADGTWCGPEVAADDVTHQVSLGNAIKVVYAHPSDVPNRFAQYADVMQSDVKAVADAFLTASNAAKTVRFDLGTSCGAAYVDIQSVTLPRTRADYMALGFSSRVTTLSNDLKPLVASSPWCPTVTSTGSCTRNFLVYADSFYAGDGTTGVATRRTDDTTGAGNYSNRGGQFAFVLGNGSGHFGLSSATTAEHELLHNLGAVQDRAPHSTLAGHCFDEIDVMCYPDGGANGITMQMNCPTAADSLIDCGNDDYFNPSGQVLGINGLPMWNVYDSAFLCAASACGAGAPGPRISSMPASPAPAPAPAAPAPPTTVKPRPVSTAPRDPLADLAKLRQPQIRKLLAGRGLRIGYRPPQSGTFTAKLLLGGRAVAAASTRARADRRVVVTLRLSTASRRKLARSAANLKLRLAFVH